jgi:hypothetical protein
MILTMPPSLPGLKRGGRVMLVERRGEAEVFYDALVVALSMDTLLAGDRGEMSIDAVLVNPFRTSTQGEDWSEALICVRNIVHHSHRDWTEHRACFAYLEPGVPTPGVDDLQRLGNRGGPLG